MRPRLLCAGAILLGVILSGCVEPAPTPSGWQRVSETGILWRPLSEAEKERWGREEHRVYVFRVPGLLDDLREDDQVRFPVRIYGGFMEADLALDRVEHGRIEGDRPRDTTTRWFEPEPPWDSAWLGMPRAFVLNGHGNAFDGWHYRVTTPYAEWEPIDDIRPDDLITMARPPCAEFGPASGNASAACLAYAEPEGY